MTLEMLHRMIVYMTKLVPLYLNFSFYMHLHSTIELVRGENHRGLDLESGSLKVVTNLVLLVRAINSGVSW